MGTNYYAIKKKPRIVRVYDSIHIGKSSAGWKFLFHTQKEYKTFEEFKNWILTQDEYIFKDEYSNKIEPITLLELIQIAQKQDNKEDFVYNKNVNGYRFSDDDFS